MEWKYKNIKIKLLSTFLKAKESIKVQNCYSFKKDFGVNIENITYKDDIIMRTT